MFDALLSSPALRALAVAALAAGAVGALFLVVGLLVRAAKPAGRTGHSDRPDLVHGPQELPQQRSPGDRYKG
jgi:hypothetical protein